MVLCPYVFLLTRHDIPPLRLQPTEVASTHWVPLRALLSPRQQTCEYQDVSARLTTGQSTVKRHVLHSMLGQMKFCAIHLIPSESLHASNVPDFIPQVKAAETTSYLARLRSLMGLPAAGQSLISPPLLLWGLTLGVLTDFLHMFPPHYAFNVWTYPTFSPLDIRLAIWLLSYRFRKQKEKELFSSFDKTLQTVDAHSEAMASLNDWSIRARRVEPGPGQASTRMPDTETSCRLETSGVSLMLEGYYDIVRQAVRYTLVARCAIVAVIAYALVRRRFKA